MSSITQIKTLALEQAKGINQTQFVNDLFRYGWARDYSLTLVGRAVQYRDLYRVSLNNLIARMREVGISVVFELGEHRRYGYRLSTIDDQFV